MKYTDPTTLPVRVRAMERLIRASQYREAQLATLDAARSSLLQPRDATDRVTLSAAAVGALTLLCAVLTVIS